MTCSACKQFLANLQACWHCLAGRKKHFQQSYKFAGHVGEGLHLHSVGLYVTPEILYKLNEPYTKLMVVFFYLAWVYVYFRGFVECGLEFDFKSLPDGRCSTEMWKKSPLQYVDNVSYYIPITDTTLELSVFWPSDTESRINELRFSESITLSFKTRLTSVTCFCGDVTLSKLQAWNQRQKTCWRDVKKRNVVAKVPAIFRD